MNVRLNCQFGQCLYQVVAVAAAYQEVAVYSVQEVAVSSLHELAISSVQQEVLHAVPP